MENAITYGGRVYLLDEWITQAAYVQRYGVTKQVITNWIGRGVIPTDCVLTIPALGLKLIRNQNYEVRAYAKHLPPAKKEGAPEEGV